MPLFCDLRDSSPDHELGGYLRSKMIFHTTEVMGIYFFCSEVACLKQCVGKVIWQLSVDGLKQED